MSAAISPTTRPSAPTSGAGPCSATAKVSKKKAFLTSTLETIAGLSGQERCGLVLAGDYNVIGRTHEPSYPVFQTFEYAFLDQLGELGLTDVHQHLHPGVQVHSWYGRGGNGYRFDYFHTGAALTAAAISCRHVEEPRTTGLSDHDAIALTLATAPPQPLQATRLATATAILF